MIRLEGRPSGGVGNGLLAGPLVSNPNIYDITFIFNLDRTNRDTNYAPIICLDDLNSGTSDSNMILDIGYTAVPGEWRLFWYGNSHENNFIQTQTGAAADFIVLNQDGEYTCRIYNNGTTIGCDITFPDTTSDSLTVAVGVNTWVNCSWTLFGSRSIWWGYNPSFAAVNQDPSQIMGDFTGSLTISTVYKDAGKTQLASIGEQVAVAVSNDGDFVVDATLNDVFLNAGQYVPTANNGYLQNTMDGDQVVHPHALRYNGVDAYVDFGDILNFGNGSTDNAMFVSAWVKINTGGLPYRVFGRYQSGSKEWLLQIDASGWLNLILYDESAGATLRQTYQVAATTDVWHHVSASYDGSGTEAGIRLYFDGVNVVATPLGTGVYVAMENFSIDFIVGSLDGSTQFNDGHIAMFAIHEYAPADFPDDSTLDSLAAYYYVNWERYFVPQLSGLPTLVPNNSVITNLLGDWLSIDGTDWLIYETVT